MGKRFDAAYFEQSKKNKQMLAEAAMMNAETGAAGVPIDQMRAEAAKTTAGAAVTGADSRAADVAQQGSLQNQRASNSWELNKQQNTFDKKAASTTRRQGLSDLADQRKYASENQKTTQTKLYQADPETGMRTSDKLVTTKPEPVKSAYEPAQGIKDELEEFKNSRTRRNYPSSISAGSMGF